MADIGDQPSSDVVADVFGDRSDLIMRYAEMLRTSGIERGLIGPRESHQLWQRHILNCVAVSELINANSCVLDMGSGAGLPGLVLAIRRPDLQLRLADSMRRRVIWLDEVITELGLGKQVSTAWSRVEGIRDEPVDYLTARAVSNSALLWKWGRRLLKPGGSLLAIKGDQVQAEYQEMQEKRIPEVAVVTITSVGVCGLSIPTRVLGITKAL